MTHQTMVAALNPRKRERQDRPVEIPLKYQRRPSSIRPEPPGWRCGTHCLAKISHRRQCPRNQRGMLTTKDTFPYLGWTRQPMLRIHPRSGPTAAYAVTYAKHWTVSLSTGTPTINAARSVQKSRSFLTTGHWSGLKRKRKNAGKRCWLAYKPT